MAIQIRGDQIKSGEVTTTQIASGTILAADLSLGTAFAFTGGLSSSLTPASDNDVANKLYVDNLLAGLAWREAAKAASTANFSGVVSGSSKVLTASAVGVTTIDGVTVALNDRVLLKDQTAGAENGIYEVTTLGTASVKTVLTRSLRMDEADEFSGSAAFVTDGTDNADTAWVCSSTVVTMGTTAATFAQFAGGGTFVGGDGITITGNSIAVNLDGTTLAKSASGVKVNAGGISNNEVSASAAIAYSKLNLGTSIVNGDVATNAAIAYSKLALGTSIVDGDIDTAGLALSSQAWRPHFDLTASAPASTTKYALGNQVAADFYDAVQVWRNGLRCSLVAVPGNNDEYKVIEESNVTKVEFGAAPDTGDTIQISSLA